MRMISHYKSILLVLLGVGCSIGCSASFALGQEKPVEVIVGTSPGGILDETARLIAKILQDHRLVKMPVTVVNKSGGGQTVAMTYLVQRPPDQSSLFIASLPVVTGHILGRTKLRFDDLTPIYHLFDEYIVLAVRVDSPLRNGKDFIEQLQNNPRALSISLGTGLANAPHLAISVILENARVDIRQLRMVVHQGGGTAITDVLGGHVDVLATSVTNVLEMVKSQKFRILAVTSPQRLGGALADAPTWKELGIDAVYSSFRCAFGPKGLTQDHVAYWERILESVTGTPEWTQNIEKNYWRSVNAGSVETMRFLKEEFRRDRDVLQKLGLAK